MRTQRDSSHPLVAPNVLAKLPAEHRAEAAKLTPDELSRAAIAYSRLLSSGASMPTTQCAWLLTEDQVPLRRAQAAAHTVQALYARGA